MAIKTTIDGIQTSATWLDVCGSRAQKERRALADAMLSYNLCRHVHSIERLLYLEYLHERSKACGRDMS